jgi:hypothetical protein
VLLESEEAHLERMVEGGGETEADGAAGDTDDRPPTERGAAIRL